MAAAGANFKWTRPMTSRVGLRRAMLALAIVAVAWVAAFASGVGWLTLRDELTGGHTAGTTVTCRYRYAAGTYETFAFTEHPDAVVCPRFASLRALPVSGEHWAAPLPGDKSAAIECRFFPANVEGDDGIGTRFAADAPLRLQVNFAARQLVTIGADVQRALGAPAFDTTLAPNDANAVIDFKQGTAGHLMLIITANGRAMLTRFAPSGPILWGRDGGCRVST
jgi:hypothetical protein